MLRIARRPALVAPALLTALALAAPAHAAYEPRGDDAEAAKVLPRKWSKRHRAKRATADPDRDGLSNWGEFRSHTRPRRADSDRDGVRDGREDFDRDGLANRAEERTGHDPGDRDGDDDGIRDGRENAGVVTAFDGTTLTIALAVGGRLTAVVDDTSCDDSGFGDDEADDADDGDYGDEDVDFGDDDTDYGDDGDDDADDELVTASLAEEGDEDDPADEDWGDDEAGDCAADVAPGAVVHQARVEDGVFVELDWLE